MFGFHLKFRSRSVLFDRSYQQNHHRHENCQENSAIRIATLFNFDRCQFTCKCDFLLLSFLVSVLSQFFKNKNFKLTCFFFISFAFCLLVVFLQKAKEKCGCGHQGEYATPREVATCLLSGDGDKDLKLIAYLWFSDRFPIPAASLPQDRTKYGSHLHSVYREDEDTNMIEPDVPSKSSEQKKDQMEV